MSHNYSVGTMVNQMRVDSLCGQSNNKIEMADQKGFVLKMTHEAVLSNYQKWTVQIQHYTPEINLFELMFIIFIICSYANMQYRDERKSNHRMSC